MEETGKKRFLITIFDIASVSVIYLELRVH